MKVLDHFINSHINPSKTNHSFLFFPPHKETRQWFTEWDLAVRVTVRVSLVNAVNRIVVQVSHPSPPSLIIASSCSGRPSNLTRFSTIDSPCLVSSKDVAWYYHTTYPLTVVRWHLYCSMRVQHHFTFFIFMKFRIAFYERWWMLHDGLVETVITAPRPTSVDIIVFLLNHNSTTLPDDRSHESTEPNLS